MGEKATLGPYVKESMVGRGAWIKGLDGNYFALALGQTDENAEANARLIIASHWLALACREFVRKVECGEARSTVSYRQMKAALALVDGNAAEVPF